MDKKRNNKDRTSFGRSAKRFGIVLICLMLICLQAAMPMSLVFAESAEETETNDTAERILRAQKEIRTKKAGRYGMVPIYGKDLKDGTYDITVDSTSPFFKVRKGSITVKDGEITGSITIGSTSYLYVYPGTKPDASRADPSTWVSPTIADGRTTFTFPIEALDKELDCAAFSKAREKWYDRKIVFNAYSLPEEALLIKLPDYDLIEMAISSLDAGMSEDILDDNKYKQGGSEGSPEAIAIDMPDGEYSIEVNLIGGSGRASVSSPTLMVVRDGKAYARLIWSSPYYDYMVVDDTMYKNLIVDGGNSQFEIPITLMDDPMSVVADTTAMGDNLEIEYALTFYSDTVGEKGAIPQEAAKLVLVIAAAIIVGGGVLNYFVKKHRAA